MMSTSPMAIDLAAATDRAADPLSHQRSVAVANAATINKKPKRKAPNKTSTRAPSQVNRTPQRVRKAAESRLGEAQDRRSQNKRRKVANRQGAVQLADSTSLSDDSDEADTDGTSSESSDSSEDEDDDDEDESEDESDREEAHAPVHAMSRLLAQINPTRLTNRALHRPNGAPPLVCCIYRLDPHQTGRQWLTECIERIEDEEERSALKHITFVSPAGEFRDKWWSDAMTRWWSVKTIRGNFNTLRKWAAEDTTATAAAAAAEANNGTSTDATPGPELALPVDDAAGKPQDLRPNLAKIELMIDEHDRSKKTSRWQKKLEQARAQKQTKKVAKAAGRLNGYRRALEEQIVDYLNLFWAKTTLASQPQVISTLGTEVLASDGLATGEIQFKHTFQSLNAFIDSHRHFEVRGYNLPKFWLSHQQCRQYDTIVFHPRPEGFVDTRAHQAFNLWRGFRIPESKAREYMRNQVGPDADESELYLRARRMIDPWLQHILDIWCEGSMTLAEYVVKWFAHILQFPWKKTKVAIVVQGKEGAGKGIVINMVGKIIGTDQNHFFPVHDVNDVMGTYTHNLTGTVLCFLDEALWGGDKEKAGLFKKLVTEPTMQHHQKYQDSYLVDSFVNIIMASNESWVVPAGTQERRVLALSASSRYAGPQTPESRAYFESIQTVPLGALAYFLYHINLDHFNPATIECTPLQRQQKILSLDPLSAWWNNCLEQGEIPHVTSYHTQSQREVPAPAAAATSAEGADGTGPGEDREWSQPILKSSVHEAYQSYCQSINSRGLRVGDSAMWKKLKEWTCKDPRGDTIEEIRGVRMPGTDKRPRCVRFPSLDHCRRAWCSEMGDPQWFSNTPEA